VVADYTDVVVAGTLALPSPFWFWIGWESDEEPGAFCEDGTTFIARSSIGGVADWTYWNTGGVQFGWKYACPRYPPSAPFLSASIRLFYTVLAKTLPWSIIVWCIALAIMSWSDSESTEKVTYLGTGNGLFLKTQLLVWPYDARQSSS
jgi:hypothetical protein